MIRYALILCAWPLAAAVNLVSVEPTVLFPRATPLRQVAIFTLVNDQTTPVTCELSAGEAPVAKVTAAAGASKHRVLVDDIAAPTELVFKAQCTGQPALQMKKAWQPARKWKVFILESSHEDLGYEDYIFNKQKEVADFIDLAKHLSGNPENQSEFERNATNRYQYTMETLVSFRNYLEERGPIAWRKLARDYIAKGAMHLGGAPSGVHPQWMDYEELARNMYPGRREMKDRYGLDLKTYMIVDNPSVSWSAAQAAAQAGFKYIARWSQGWRSGGKNDYRTTQVPALFWWQGPNGKDRVLYGWRSSYGQGFWFGQSGAGNSARSILGDLPSDFVNRYLRRVESGELIGPYPYDAIVEPSYGDHDVPFYDRGLLARWSSQFAYPEIRVTGPDPFFAYIESRWGDQLPVLRGELNNFSADYATIDPESQGWKRDAARLLPLAETVGALASAHTPGLMLSPAAVNRAYTRLFDYDEHSWPTLLPASDVQLFNAAWIKKHEAKRALSDAAGLWKQASTAFARHIASNSNTLAVFNGLAHRRTSLVEWEGRAASLVDLATNKRIAVEQRDGKSIFVAEDVPALGYRLYRIDAKPAPPTTSLTATKDSIGNEFYEIRFDATTGVVRSIREKATGREWIDATAPHGANQMVYVSTSAREAKPTDSHSPARAKQQSSSTGPVSARFQVLIDDDRTGAAIEQTVTLYAGLKRIDFVNKLAHVRSLFTDRFADRYRENLFYAFPFSVEGGEFRAEYPGGVVRPYVDQLRWGTHDYLMANRWIDVGSPQGGVTVAPWNAATFHLGEIRYNQFSVDYRPTKSHLYSYAWSNRMAGLLTTSPDDCNATLGYSMTTRGPEPADRFGWDVATPLTAISLGTNPQGPWKEAARSFLQVDSPNVQLTVLKPSDQPGRGWVLRFAETQGRATSAEIDLSALGVLRAYESDLVENDRQAIAVQQGRLRLVLAPYSLTTLRVETGPAPSSQIALSASAVTDESVRLAWTGGPAPAYDVYRSLDPEDPPTATTWIARTTAPVFVDHGLSYRTAYTYHVVPVNQHHHQAAFARVTVSTASRNLSPPAVVEEPGVIKRSKDMLFLYWRKNQEPDLARYVIYRGDTANFALLQPLAVVEPSGKFLEMFVDRNLEPGREYFYRIFPEDHAGHRQTQSPTISGRTTK